MKLKLFYLFLIIVTTNAYSQYSVKGKVIDALSQNPLAYCTVRLENNTLGTTTNQNGDFELKLKNGKYKIIATYMGYLSSTREIEVDNKPVTLDMSLHPSDVRFPEIVISPGENPALEIIRKCIESKKRRNNFINTFEYETYTKAVVKTDQDISVSGNTASIGIGGDDSADTKDLSIAGILESKSKGYFEKPDRKKEFIVARKQTANFPAYANTLTGGSLLQNFYDETIDILGKNIPSPISDKALDYYYYYIISKNTFVDRVVFEIYVAPDNEADPGFTGKIYITDETFDLLKVDLELNRSANTGGLFDTLQVFQQFNYFSGNIPMPVDYRMVIKANFLGLLRFGIELSTILHDYKINASIDEDIFNNVILSVNTDADKKDSLYWTNAQVIPGTEEEQQAYTRIDSVVSIPRTFWDRFNLLSTSTSLNDNWSISGPLSIYHFNRIEGNSLDFAVNTYNLLDYRLNSSLALSYGFSDEKFKYNYHIDYLLGKYRTYNLDFNIYDKLNVLFEKGDVYSDFTSSVLALISKYEFRDYFYRKGFDFSAGGEVLPVLDLNAGFKYNSDMPAYKKTRVSIFAKDKKFKENLPITASNEKIITAGFKLDFRNSIEDGLYRRRTGNNNYFTLEGDVEIAKPEFLKNDFAYNRYNLELKGNILTFRSAEILFKLQGSVSEGNLPYHYFNSLPGNLDGVSMDNSFRTLGVNEVIANRSAVLYLKYDFYDEIFKILRIPFLKEVDLTLSGFFNAAYTRIDNDLLKNIPGGLNYPEFKTPLMEAGFSLGHVLMPLLKLDFAWRLNHRSFNKDNNFRISINAGIL